MLMIVLLTTERLNRHRSHDYCRIKTSHQGGKCTGIDDDRDEGRASDNEGEAGFSGNDAMDGFDAIMNDDGGLSDDERSRAEAARPVPKPRATIIRPEKRNLQRPFQSGAFPQGKCIRLKSPLQLQSCVWTLQRRQGNAEQMLERFICLYVLESKIWHSQGPCKMVEDEESFKQGSRVLLDAGDSDRRWLCYNLRGGVSLKEDNEMNILETTFHDTVADNRRVPPYRDYNSLQSAAFGDRVWLCCLESYAITSGPKFFETWQDVDG